MENATNFMVTLYDPFKPITKCFVQIYKGVKLYDSENTPFTNSHIIAKVYILVQKTLLYSEVSWDSRPTTENIWFNFRINFYQ